MKRYLLSLVFIFCVNTLEAATSPLLVVLIMVKDEQAAIVPTLESFLPTELAVGKEDPQEVAYVVYDTGSTDETVQRAEDFFEAHGIVNYTVVSEQHPVPFHYGNGRNKALEIARTRYPHSTFIVFPDAEWYMDDFDSFLEFCKDEYRRALRGEELPSHYKILLHSASTTTPQARLFLTNDDVIFEGRKHELPNKFTETWLPKSIFMEYKTTKYGGEKSRQRWYNDRNDWIRELEEDPTNSRALYYNALTEQWLGHYDIAYLYFKKRAKIDIFPEEDFMAWYNLGMTTDILAREQPDSYTWEEALGYYLKALTMRPHRAEPLIRLAEHYLHQQNYEVSYLFAKRAAELPIPDIEAELLPMYIKDYTFHRWEVLSRCAWYVGDFELGEKAAKLAIEAEPNLAYLYGNLASYWEK